MATFTYTDSFSVGGTGINGATVNAYKASRFSGVPALNAAAPGSADATATTGTTAGFNGAFEIALPTYEDYYISVTYLGNTYWKGPVSQVFTDGSGALGTTVPAGSTGETGDVLVSGGVATLQDTANVEGLGRAGSLQAVRRHGSTAWDSVPNGLQQSTGLAAGMAGVNINTFAGSGTIIVPPLNPYAFPSPTGPWFQGIGATCIGRIATTQSAGGKTYGYISYTGTTLDANGNITAFTGCTALNSAAGVIGATDQFYSAPFAEVDVVVAADSILTGEASTIVTVPSANPVALPYTDWFTNLLGREARNAGLPDPGRGFKGCYNPFFTGIQWGNLAAGAVINSTSLGPSAVDGTKSICWNPGGNTNVIGDTGFFRRAIVFVQTQTSGATFQVSFNGGSTFTSSIASTPATGNNLIMVDSGDLGSLAQRTIQVKQTSTGSAGVAVGGYLPITNDGTSGIVGCNFAYSGTTANQWANTYSGWDSVWVDALNPRRVYVAVGLNDLNTGRTLTQIQTDLTTIINKIQAAAPYTEVVLCAEWHAGNTANSYNTGITNANWFTQFVSMVNTLAFTKNCTFISMADWFGDAAIWTVATCTTTAAGTSATVPSGGFPNVEVGMTVEGAVMPPYSNPVKVSSIVGNTVNFSGNTNAIKTSTNTFAASATNGTTTLTFSTANAALILVGQAVTGAGISANGLVTAVNYVTGVVTISGTITTLTISSYTFSNVTLTFTNDVLGVSGNDGVHFGDQFQSTSGRDAQVAIADMFWNNISFYKSVGTSSPAPGWTFDRAPWVRVSNTQFTITDFRNLTGIYTAGTKVTWSESNVVKYGTISSSSYTNCVTTVNLMTTSDFVMAATPDALSTWYSLQTYPTGFPTTFTWSGFAMTGITASGVFVGNYSTLTPHVMWLNFVTAVAPTSNATTTTITGAPIAAATQTVNIGYGTDNGANTPGVQCQIAGAGTTITLSKLNGAAWTNVSTKSATFQLIYPY